MSRWIEVEPLIDLSIPVLCGGGNEEMAVLVEDIDSAPSIEIVRCRECKHWNEDFILTCRRHISKVDSDDFCSYGVKVSEIPTGSERSE